MRGIENVFRFFPKYNNIKPIVNFNKKPVIKKKNKKNPIDNMKTVPEKAFCSKNILQTSTTFLAAVFCAAAMLPLYGSDQLDEYIKEGLRNNLSLKQAVADMECAEESVNEARSQFFPSVWLKSRYSRAEGGRSVTIPVGDILLETFGKTPLFAQPGGITPPPPVTVYIMPEKEQETKIQLTQPLFAPALISNYRMNLELLSVNEHAFRSVALALIRDIRIAYYNCLQASEGKTVYNAACKRSERNLYTAQKLFEAGMLSESSVLVAQAEDGRNKTALERSRADFENACKAFNLLLNRPLDTPPLLIAPDSAEVESLLIVNVRKDSLWNISAQKSRPEILQLESALKASKSRLGIEKSSFAPTIAAAFEGGIIGDKFEINDRNTFYTASLLLQWELFSGAGRMHKLKKAYSAMEKIEEQYRETIQKIKLQVEKACSDFEIAQREYRTACFQYRAADINYVSVYKKFGEGAASLNELTEAEELLTKAEAGRSIARYELFKQQANLFYASAVDGERITYFSAQRGR